MLKIGFKIERGEGGKPIFNEFKIANFTETLDLIPKRIYWTLLHTFCCLVGDLEDNITLLYMYLCAVQKSYKTLTD